ncbi:serine/threonine protein kinase [Kribbella antibiotica]|uniref:non-specific serine/threonine protein kinase n=2 Tax=Kribbella antibiotica TaxID=190195 RepID=A0A4R4ZVT0_9ACTN|nr:serine/threonine protein kinase [Kribbella antibiotica]
MGDVYRAVDVVLQREVALKLVRPVADTLMATERFQREARAIAQIRDPNVVSAYDFGSDGPDSYLAMELVTGCTVGEELREYGPFTADRALHVVRQAAAGLAAAHEQGVVHRDVKPGNLLLAEDGTVKVADFGIVRFLDEETTTMTSSAQIVGTSHFLAPERALGKPAGPASDIYALGCVLYQLVTGRTPFTADEPAAIMFQHVEREPVAPSELRPELAGECEELILWMLAKDPAKRPTALQIAGGARPSNDTTTTELPPVRRPDRRRVLAGASAGLVLAASAVVGVAVYNEAEQKPATDSLLPGKPSVEPTATAVAVRTTTRPPVTRSTKPTTVRTTGPKLTKSTKSAKPVKSSKPDKTKKPKKPKPSSGKP